MFRYRSPVPLLVSAAAIFGLVYLSVPTPSVSPPLAEDASAPPHRPSEPSPTVAGTAGRWLVAGGGPTPEMNQVQIEQDLELARNVFSAFGAGRLLFAGGPGGRSVQVLVGAAPSTLEGRLGALFDPRSGRDSRYRRTRLAVDGPAERDALLSVLDAMLAQGEGPLTIYLAGHGDGGEEPQQSRFGTWGGADLWVEDLADLLDGMPDHRPARFVITSCHAGGFAEMAFAGADPERGPAETSRCGFFATTFDRVAAGCDPNPDRGAQEGYGIHFLHALRGEDRGGAELPEIDLDHDGVISLLEAHTRARIASGSFDLPVTTSETFLRAAVDPSDGTAGRRDQPASDLLPEELAVVEQLGEELGLLDEASVLARIYRLRESAEVSGVQLADVEEALAHVTARLAAALLHRWPVLDDPWHPHFLDTLASERVEIERYLAASALATEVRELEAQRDRLGEAHDAEWIALAPVERLARAHETLRLAAQLRAVGGPYWRHYQTLLACERGAP